MKKKSILLALSILFCLMGFAKVTMKMKIYTHHDYSRLVSYELPVCELDTLEYFEDSTDKVVELGCVDSLKAWYDMKNEEDAIKALDRIYRSMNAYGKSEWGFKPQIYTLGYPTMDIQPMHDPNEENWTKENWMCWPQYCTGDEPYLLETWNCCYAGIAQCTHFLQALDGIPWTSETLKNTLIGEALTIRGYFYYYLGITFGPVPIYTKENWFKEIQSIPNKDEFWGYVMEDFIKAKNVFPNDTRKPKDASPVGLYSYMNKYIAETYLVCAYCWYAQVCKQCNELAGGGGSSIMLPDGTNITQADIVVCLKEIIKSGEYSLLDDYRSIWEAGFLDGKKYIPPYSIYSELYSDSKEYLKDVERMTDFYADMRQEDIVFVRPSTLNGKREILWGQISEPTELSSTTYSYSVEVPHIPILTYSAYPAYRGTGDMFLSDQLFEWWGNVESNGGYNDIRKLSTIIDLENESGGDVFKLDSNGYKFDTEKKKIVYTDSITKATKIAPPFCLRKYWKASVDKEKLRPAPIIDKRYSEVLLLATELTGDASYMNQVQKRAGVPETQYSLIVLQQEYISEFATEWTLCPILQRHGIMKQYIETRCAGTKLAEKKYEPTIIYYPLPNAVRDRVDFTGHSQKNIP